jgi:uncharacterized membrane protein
MVLIYVHIITLVIWLGGMIFFSVVAAPSIFLNLDRETAGKVVGVIFPKYFMIGYVASLTLIGTLLAIWKDNLQAVKAPLGILSVCVGLAFVSGMVVGEKARAIKAKMYSAQEIQTNTELRDRFHAVHRLSTALNVALLILLMVYAGYLPRVIGAKPSLLESLPNLFGK